MDVEKKRLASFVEAANWMQISISHANAKLAAIYLSNRSEGWCGGEWEIEDGKGIPGLAVVKIYCPVAKRNSSSCKSAICIRVLCDAANDVKRVGKVVEN